MSAIRKYINKFSEILSILSMGSLVCIVTWQVITRFILKNPSTTTEQLARYLFVWVILINASYIFGKRGHMNIGFLLTKMKAFPKLICEIVSEVVTLIFMLCVMAFGGVFAVQIGIPQMDAALPVSMAIFYSILPLCGIITVIYSILNICDLIKDYGKERK